MLLWYKRNMNGNEEGNQKFLKKMLSKWEWIEETCKRNGLTGSAHAARKLENTLIRIYGDTKTQSWKDDYETLGGFDIATVAMIKTSSPYCIACEDSSKNCLRCTKCRLAIEDFGCDNRFSLYREFCKIFELEYWEYQNLKNLSRG